MLLERKLIKKYAFKLLVEAGFFDDFSDDQTEVLIPYYLSPEQKQELISRYEKMDVPYVVQSNPDDQPNPGDVMDPPRTNRQIKRDVLQQADQLKNMSRTSRAPRLPGLDPDMQSEKTLPLSQISKMSQSEKTLPTGVIDDYSEYSDYSDPQGLDAEMSRISDIGSEDSSLDDYTFNFDNFIMPDEASLPYIDSDVDLSKKQIRKESLSRGALIRKKYFGRY